MSQSGDNDTYDRDRTRARDDFDVRKRIADILAEGLETQTEPFPETTREFDSILNEISRLPLDHLEQKLIISGFINHAVGEQSCENCIYYLPHRKYCDLPELSLPVEADWWCRLWRI